MALTVRRNGKSPGTTVDRRSMVAGIVGCCSICAVGPAWGQVPNIFVPLAPRGIIACGSEPGANGAFNPAASRTLSKSGTKQIDDGFSVERGFLDYFFGLSGSDGTKNFGRPEFHFYDDADEKIGARALRGGPAGCGIYVGLNLIAAEVNRPSNHWGTVIAGIMAHEWAHAYQYGSGLDERIFLWETHADYLAGWYLGAKRSFGIPIEPDYFAQALFRRGNENGFFDDNNYGSPQQRVSAMTEGMKFGLSNTSPNRRPSISDAAKAGYRVVSQMRQRSQHG